MSSGILDGASRHANQKSDSLSYLASDMGCNILHEIGDLRSSKKKERVSLLVMLILGETSTAIAWMSSHWHKKSNEMSSELFELAFAKLTEFHALERDPCKSKAGDCGQVLLAPFFA